MRNKFIALSSEFIANRGVLLMELLIVIMIIGLLVAGAVKTWDVNIQQARFDATSKEMDQLVYAITGNPELFSESGRTDFGFIGDMGKLPDRLEDLVVQPSGSSAWRGPYIKVKFAENPNDYLQDAWGSNYIYYRDSLIIRSYTSGNEQTPQSWINRRIAKDSTSLLRNTISGFVKDLSGNPPGYKNQYIKVYISYPIQGNLWTPTGFMPNEEGSYLISDVPQGNHRMWCIYDTTLQTPNDTTDFQEKYVCAYPGLNNTVNFRLTIGF